MNYSEPLPKSPKEQGLWARFRAMGWRFNEEGFFWYHPGSGK